MVVPKPRYDRLKVSFNIEKLEMEVMFLMKKETNIKWIISQLVPFQFAVSRMSILLSDYYDRKAGFLIKKNLIVNDYNIQREI